MNNDSSAIVSKVWNYAHVLKNAGVGYGDYVEQITYLLFLKLADEILVFEQGRITARGDHPTLMQSSSLYQKLYEKQEL